MAPNDVYGYCVVAGGGRHRNCQHYSMDIANCKIACSVDVDCQGYSYISDYTRCYVYTTSECQSGFTLNNHDYTGVIKHQYSAWSQGVSEYGCYIKQKGKQHS